jgi:hypothetical protein
VDAWESAFLKAFKNHSDEEIQENEAHQDRVPHQEPKVCGGKYTSHIIQHHPTSSNRSKKFAIQSIRTLIVSHSFPLSFPKNQPYPSILPSFPNM